MSEERDRVICVPLSEAEWTAFTARIPEPVDWLRRQILAQFEGAKPLPGPQSAVRPDRAWSSSRA